MSDRSSLSWAEADAGDGDGGDAEAVGLDLGDLEAGVGGFVSSTSDTLLSPSSQQKNPVRFSGKTCFIAIV
jgi:hypothetical protein